MSSSDNNNSSLYPWFEFFAVLEFDIEIGPTLKSVYPNNSIDKESSIVSALQYNAFPDSNSSNEESQYFIRIHKEGCENSRKRNAFLYGSVFFSRVKDESVNRGYVQQSIVVVSRLPVMFLMKETAHLLSTMLFDSSVRDDIALDYKESDSMSRSEFVDNSILELASKDVNKWASPIKGKKFELPLLGNVMKFDFPRVHSIPLPPDIDNTGVGYHLKNMDLVTKQRLLYSNLNDFDKAGLYTSFPYPDISIPYLWELWEHILLGHPILVIGSDANLVSNVVLSLVSIINPLSFSGDFRPIFSVHDPDFGFYSDTLSEWISNKDSSKNLSPTCLIGVTNPFFLKSFKGWPHILNLDSFEERPSSSLSNLGGLLKSKTQFLSSKYKSHSKIDKNILKQVKNAKVPEVANLILKDYFFAETLSFMHPLEQYFNSLIPSPKSILPYYRLPSIGSFVEDDFYSNYLFSDNPGISLEGSGKTHLYELYRLFLRSSTFREWFIYRKKVSTSELSNLQQKSIFSFDINSFAETKGELELVDLYLRIREKLQELNNSESENVKDDDGVSLLEICNVHLKIVLIHLPADLVDSFATPQFV